MIGLLSTGIVLLFIAGFVSNGALECILLGKASKNLAWGPTLFRVMLAIHGMFLIFTSIILKKRPRDMNSSFQQISNVNIGESENKVRYAWVVLTVLSVIALALRLWHLNSCLWYDELITLLDFVRPSLGEIITSFSSQNQHMLYSILAHVSICIFGESAWALRLPSVVFGVASLWAIFLLGRRVIGTREALLACALMTVSYHHIWFSQNARGYMGLMFFTTLATWLWLEALSQSSWRWWLYYVIAVSLGLWIHMTMIFVVATHGLIYLLLLIDLKRVNSTSISNLLANSSWWKPSVALILCGTVTLQLYALSLPEFLRTALHEASLQSEWTNPLWLITESLKNLQIGFSGIVIVLAGGILVGIGLLSIMRKEWSVGLLMVLPGLLGGLTMVILGHNLWPRFFFFGMGFALLILVRGALKVPDSFFSIIAGLQSRHRLATITGLILTCLMIMASGATLARYYRLPKQDFTGARYYVEQMRQPEDEVIAIGLAGVAYNRYFAPDWLFARTSKELTKSLQNHDSLWLIYTLPIQVKAFQPEVWAIIESEFELVKVFPGTLSGGEINVCRKRIKK